MKNYFKIGAMMMLMAFIAIMLAGLVSLAQTASPSPTAAAIVAAPQPDLGTTLLGVLGLVKSWGTLGIYAGIATALKLLIDLLKSTGLYAKIPESWQGLFVVLVGVISIGLTTLAAGGTLPEALSASLGSSAGAMLLHEVWQDFFSKNDPPAIAPIAKV